MVRESRLQMALLSVQGLVQPTAGTELRHMLDLCLYFIPAHRLKVRALHLCMMWCACSHAQLMMERDDRAQEDLGRDSPQALRLLAGLCICLDARNRSVWLSGGGRSRAAQCRACCVCSGQGQAQRTPANSCVDVQAVDLHFMAALSKEVALIPVIAKSDSMTTPELVAFKSEVVQRLQDPRIEGACCLCFDVLWYTILKQLLAWKQEVSA